MDDDLDGLTGPPEEELSLPKATVTKLIHEMMPKDLTCAKETRDVLADCCVEFIHLLSSEANDRCEEEQKKTIAGDHVIKALESLGFEEYVKEVMEVYEDHTKTQKDRERRNTKTESTLTDAEKIAMQEQMFAEARARMLGQQLEGGPSTAEAPESDDDDDVKSE